MSTLLQDLRYALRALRHNPAFTTVVVITLALGIGANTAIFSVVDAVLLKPLPYPHADRLVSLDTKVPGPGKDIFGSAMSYPDIQQLQALTRDFAGVAAYTYARYNYAGSGQASELAATVVSPNLFGVLGVSPAIGRGFTGAELHDQLAVLSYRMWATAFGSDRDIVGRAINLDGQSALATRALRTMLFGVSTLDAITFIGAALVLGGVSMLATYVPARRAARIDPMVALRYE